MKKRSMALAIILILSFMLVACGENTNSTVANNHNNEEILEDNVAEENDSEDSTEQEEETEVEEVMEDVEEDEEISLDQGLTGFDLLASIGEATAPSKLVMTSESTMMGAKTITKTYTEGDKTRSEVMMDGFGTMITISLNNGEEIYSWEDGATEGTKIVGMSVEEAAEFGYMSDDSELFAEITDESSPDLTARVDVLNGEEVIYIEGKESDGDAGEVDIFMWYSVKYATPLKYEMYMGGEEPVASYIVTDIDKKMNIDNSMFTPPAEVNFTEVDMGAMMSGDMFDENMFDNMD